jgi:drug/metabolite transporter (DMT)-like permease
MRSTILYTMTVLIWGSTWLAIEFQLGDVAPEVSLVYRFAIAGALMWTYCLYKGLPMSFQKRDHSFFLVLAVCNFGLNYFILYCAQAYLSSAMASIAFSTLLLMNIVNSRLFFGKAVAKRIYFGALLGIAGLVTLFWRDIRDFDFASDAIIGLSLALIGTLIASFGNMASVRNSTRNIGVLQGNAWGMLYGTGVLLAVVLITGAEFTFSMTMAYVVSLVYLAVFGTVIAFACYFMLLKDIGPEKASYSIVLFPVVAVTLSTLYEGFQWHANTFWGFVFVLTGNAIVLTPVHKIRALLSGKRSHPAI